MKHLGIGSAVLALAAILCLGGLSRAEDQAKTISGKSMCAGCSGVADKCSLALTDKDGARWVLTGDSDSYKAAFKARMSGKTITATLAGDPVTKTGKDGKEYKEVKVSEVKVSEG